MPGFSCVHIFLTLTLDSWPLSEIRGAAAALCDAFQQTKTNHSIYNSTQTPSSTHQLTT
jgi:hypothetical protein